MNNATATKKIDNSSEVREINMPNTEKKKKNSNSRSLLIMTSLSLLVMIVAVALIYYNIKSDPDLVHNNDQTSQVQENDGFVNPMRVDR